MATKPTSTPAPQRRLGLDPLASFGLSAVLVFFIVSGGFAYRNLQTLKTDNQWIVHSHQVMVTLGDLLSALQNAETGQRGFLLTGNEKYLEPYQSALAEIASLADDLTDLTRDNPNQQARIRPLRSHIDAKLAELKQTIDSRRNAGADAALAVVNTDRGKVEMDAVRSQLVAMDQEEADLRQKRLAEMDAAYNLALATAVLSSLLGIVLAHDRRLA